MAFIAVYNLEKLKTFHGSIFRVRPRSPAPVTTFPAIIGDRNVGRSSGAAPVHQHQYNKDFPSLNNNANSAVRNSTNSVPKRTNANSAVQQNVSNKNFGNSMADKSSSGALRDINDKEEEDWSSASFESPEHSNQSNNHENFNKKESPKKFNDKVNSSDGRERTFRDVRSWQSDNVPEKNWRIPDRSYKRRPWHRDNFPRNQHCSFSKQQCERISDEAPKQLVVGETSPDIHGNWLNDSDNENNLDKNDTPWPSSDGTIEIPKTQLNVQAPEFVPTKISNPININSDSNPFSTFDLKELITYEVDLMLGTILRDFSFGLREKVIEKIDDFSENDRRDVKLLVQITDGSQTDKNQILITSRLCEIVKDAFYSPSSTSDTSASCGRNAGLLPRGRN